jgi:hypothetical protein
VAETITTALNATFGLADKTDLAVTENGVGSTVTIGTAATLTFWRIYIASSASAATPSTSVGSPKNLLAHIDAKLSANWVVALNTAGFVTFRYTGAGTGTIVFPDTTLRNALGYQANISLASGATSQASYHPTHTAYFLGAANATNWQDDPPLAALAETRDGRTYGYADSAAVQTYTFDGLYHPYEWNSRTALGLSATDSSATPYQGDASRRKTRASTAGITPPFGLTDFFYACVANNSYDANGAKCGALLGTFQTALAGTTTTFDEVFVSAETLTKRNAAKPSIPNWSLRMNWERIALRWYATGTL